MRNFALGAGMIVALLGLAMAEDRGWLEWIDGADAWVDDMRIVVVRTRHATHHRPWYLSLCPPQYRRGGGGVTCITDGDSGVADGEPWRLTTRSGGVDAPEVGRPECPAERTAGNRATRRLQSLMSSGYTMSGRSHDNNGRRLVVVKLADGRDAGLILIEEVLAQPWPNPSNPWC
jgi:endonuclease YncB( thermonuclease family)